MKSFVKERNDLKVQHQIHISYDKEVNNGSTAKESNEDVSIDQWSTCNSLEAGENSVSQKN